MSLSYQKFNSFVANIANGNYNLGSDSIKVVLTDVAPTATNNSYSDLTPISMTNLSAQVFTTASSSQSGGTYKLMLNALTLTASGTVPQWRYIVVFDNTPASHQLIGWFDYGSEVNMLNTDTLTITPDQTNGFIQLA